MLQSKKRAAAMKQQLAAKQQDKAHLAV